MVNVSFSQNEEIAVTLTCGEIRSAVCPSNGLNHHYLLPAGKSIGELLSDILRSPPPSACIFVEEHSSSSGSSCFYLAAIEDDADGCVPLPSRMTLADAALKHGTPQLAFTGIATLSLRLIASSLHMCVASPILVTRTTPACIGKLTRSPQGLEHLPTDRRKQAMAIPAHRRLVLRRRSANLHVRRHRHALSIPVHEQLPLQ